jgi:hypothetical protein
MSIARKPVLPVMLMIVPPPPEPLPRRTTPPALIFNVLLMLNVPGARRTAPRNPLASGVRAATALMAAWMAEVSSPPEGLTFRRTGKFGRLTPPPM